MNLVWTGVVNAALISNQPGATSVIAIGALAAAGIDIDVTWPLVVALGAMTAPLLLRALKPSPSKPPQVADIKRGVVGVGAVVAFAVSVAWQWPAQWVVALVAQTSLVMVSYALAGARAGLHLWWLILTLLMLLVTGATAQHASFAWVMGVGWCEATLLVAISLFVPNKVSGDFMDGWHHHMSALEDEDTVDTGDEDL